MKTFCAGLIKNNKPDSISIATWIKKNQQQQPQQTWQMIAIKLQE